MFATELNTLSAKVAGTVSALLITRFEKSVGILSTNPIKELLKSTEIFVRFPAKSAIPIELAKFSA